MPNLVAQKLLAAAALPFELHGHKLHISASIGISFYPDDGASAEVLMKNADVAMYRAKEMGRNNYQFYHADMNARSFERLSMETSMRRALEREQFELYYQPRYEMPDGRIVGVETLIRWHHPDLGLVFPAQFIPLAEEAGLILPIGEWVLRAAATQGQAWQQAGASAFVQSGQHLRPAVRADRFCRKSSDKFCRILVLTPAGLNLNRRKPRLCTMPRRMTNP